MRSTIQMCAIAALAAVALPLHAQDTTRAATAGQHAAHQAAMPAATGLRAELVKDVEQLEKKYIALAEAETQEQYMYRPAAGVRSTSEVFMHVAGANLMIPGIIGMKADSAAQAAASERISTKAEVVSALRHSFQHVKHALMMTPDSDLDRPVKLFGQDATVRSTLVLTVSHMHEHLGQAIAYARAQGIQPPWSGGN